jgi:hypothetical protein
MNAVHLKGYPAPLFGVPRIRDRGRNQDSPFEYEHKLVLTWPHACRLLVHILSTQYLAKGMIAREVAEMMSDQERSDER